MIGDIGGASMDFLSNPMEGVSDAIGNNVDFIKALSSEDPEALSKFLEGNPSFLTTKTPVGIPALPSTSVGFAPTGGFVAQNPNFLNSAQQVLRGGY